MTETSSIAIARISGEIIDTDAVEIGELYERARASIVDSVQYQIQCGERLNKKKAVLPHGAWLPWLQENAAVLGFSSRRTATLLMKAANQNGKPASHLDEAEAVKLSRKIWGHSQPADNHRAQGTGENEWYTPVEYLDAARDVLGGIDLDPASSEIAQAQVDATRYFTKANDGLTQQWHGRIWLNPPYAQPDIAHFVSKMVEERIAGRITAAIVLTHNYTDTAWFHEAAGAADAICFTRGRIKFHDDNGNIAAPTQGQAFFYFGHSSEIFTDRFGEIGFVVQIQAGGRNV